MTTLPRNRDLQEESPCPGLTVDAVFRLWRAAMKDDDRLIDRLIQTLYDDMVSFDCKRTGSVMKLVIHRDRSATSAFDALLIDLKRFRHDGHHLRLSTSSYMGGGKASEAG